MTSKLQDKAWTGDGKFPSSCDSGGTHDGVAEPSSVWLLVPWC